MLSNNGSIARSYSKYRPHSSNLLNKSVRPWFTCTELASIYKCPPPNPTKKVCIGVISLGGGLFGTLSNNGILKDGDVHAYWTALGIPASNHPTVIIKTLGDSSNMPTSSITSYNYGATIENTVDVETIGSWYPSSNLSIIMYLANQYVDNNAFYNTFNYAINNNVTINNVNYRPSTLSVSWGFTEIYNTSQINQINPLLSNAASRGINIFCASGDGGSTDGIPGKLSYVDFPSSSPYVVACGGTKLVCPNKIYDKSTIETAWLYGGGGISKIFPKPSYQNPKVTQSSNKRCTPDIALNADPNTGVYYIFAGQGGIVGGTSIVSPAMAALTQTLSTNTFLNNNLYTAYPNAFNDITVGSNGAYKATASYDLCTGLGSLNISSLFTSINPILTTGITLTQLNVSLRVRAKILFTATIQPTNATNKTLNWSSSNPKIASVSASGLVTAVKVGTTTITATQETINASTTLTVTASLAKVKNIVLKRNETCEINLISKANIVNYNILNESNSVVDSVYLNGILTLKGLNVGISDIIIEDESGVDHGVLNVSVI